MTIRDIMTTDPVCCEPGTGLREIARMMVDNHCGEIPICDDSGAAIGVVTDRDIVCRVIATGMNPSEVLARDCMSQPVVTATPDLTIEECARLMEQYRVRRIPVVDQRGACCGIVAQADLARKGSRERTAEVVERVSEPSMMASGIGAS